jgi:hypothetical protein
MTNPTTEPDGPARITDDFAQTRHISTRAGARQAWERLTVYEKEFRLGHLADRKRAGISKANFEDEVKRALERRDAAKEFDEGWAICSASWPAGFNPDSIKVAGCPGSFVDHQRDVKRFWERVRQEMGTNDWMICRRVCGEGYKVAETIASITPAYQAVTLARFREALDALIEVLARCRK